MAEISAFLGSALTTIDPKGRMAIPAAFRNPIIANSNGESAVVFSFNAQGQCLQGYGTERLNALLAERESERRDRAG